MTLFFVGGAQRAGTTVLQSLLCQASGTNPMIMEARYLRDLVRAYARAKLNWNNPTKDYFDSPDSLRQFHSRFIEQFLRNTSSRHDDARHLVLKEPHLTIYLPDLLELLPTARFLVILRDPRDAIASMVEVGRKIKDEGNAHFFQKRDMAQLSKYFQSFYAQVLVAKNAEIAAHTYLIRYEDLVTDPVAHLRGLREFTGLDLDHHISDQTRAGSVSHRMDRTKNAAWLTESHFRSLSPSSIGRHRTILSRKEIQEIEKRCRGFFTAFGYT